MAIHVGRLAISAIGVSSARCPSATNRSIPEVDVIPVLTYADVAEAAAWLTRAFGFVERLRIGDHRVQLLVGAGAVFVTSGAGAPPSGSSVMVRVADADAHCTRARAAGARIVDEPTTYPYGKRQYTTIDPGGNAWTFSQSVDDVDPASWGGALVQA